MTMATKRARACVRVSQAARRLECMVNDHHPARVRQAATVRRYAGCIIREAERLGMMATARRARQLINKVTFATGRAE